MVDPGEHVSVTLKREFAEEAMNSEEATEEMVECFSIRLKQINCKPKVFKYFYIFASYLYSYSIAFLLAFRNILKRYFM